jgi:hypothetical protein
MIKNPELSKLRRSVPAVVLTALSILTLAGCANSDNQTLHDCLSGDPKSEKLTPEYRQKICAEYDKTERNMPQLDLDWNNGTANLRFDVDSGRESKDLGPLKSANAKKLEILRAKSMHRIAPGHEESYTASIGITFRSIAQKDAGLDCYNDTMNGALFPEPGDTVPADICIAAWKTVIADGVFKPSRDLA